MARDRYALTIRRGEVFTSVMERALRFWNERER